MSGVDPATPLPHHRSSSNHSDSLSTSSQLGQSFLYSGETCTSRHHKYHGLIIEARFASHASCASLLLRYFNPTSGFSFASWILPLLCTSTFPSILCSKYAFRIINPVVCVLAASFV